MTEFARDARIVISFQSFWTSGTGEGAGRQSDTRCHRDRKGLPALPMSQIKGTLRETAEYLAANSSFGVTPERVRRLFGGRTLPGDAAEPETGALSLASEDAAIAEDVSVHLIPHKDTLFHRVASTALNEDGVARDRTLRSIEVAVPVVLIGRIHWSAATPPDFDWIECLDQICAATPAFGKAKRDGYGRALARADCDPQARASMGELDTDGPEIPAGAFMLDLTLVPRRNAVFSGRSATEGAHATLPAPTGAALLGWCAQTAGYENVDPLKVFHSGAVSFGDARPAGLRANDEVVPVPATFAVPKGQEKAAKTLAGVLDPTVVRNGRPPDGEAHEIQYEALKDRLMTTGYAIITPQTSQRLRTATSDGRASTGQLFGVQHLVGGKGGKGQDSVFTARITIGASVRRADARRIVDAFAGRTLTIGKGRNTGYGGAFDCTAQILLPDDDLLDENYSGLLRVLVLSDIAAVNSFGAPASMLDPADLGFPGASFDPQVSVVRHRRFAPWNGALRCRDTERQVIEAGSVLAYHVPKTDRPRQIARRQRVGAWQEAGLGAVWLNPPFLGGWELPSALDNHLGDAVADTLCETETVVPPFIDRAGRSEEWALISWAAERAMVVAKAAAVTESNLRSRED